MHVQKSSSSFRRRLPVAGLLSLMSGVAAAQQGPVSADPEMVNPRFGHNTVIGVPAPDADVRNTVRWGLVFQYQRNPVVGYRLDEEVGAIVQNRLAAHAGVSWDFTSWGTARVVVPVAVNWGTEIPPFEASGFGFGDISVGLQLLPVQTKYFNLGFHGDLTLPTGRARAYMGEPSVRGFGGIQLMGKVGFKDLVTLDIIGDAGVVGRQVLVTRQDFDNGPELILSEALRLRLAWLPVDIAFVQALTARSGFTNFFNGGAENGIEIYGGVQIPIHNIGFNTDMQIDVMAGRGLTQGYGNTDLRVLGGLTFTRNPGRKPKIVLVEPPPPVIPPPPPEEPPEGPPPEVERIGDEIVIRKPVEFFVDTANLKPESIPILDQVAEIINSDARIKHVVVEGHASEEGDFEYNYDLSKRRAEAVYRQLILTGVAPDRLSYASYGEVRPKVEGSTEEAWAINRRVEFHVVAEYTDNEVVGGYPDYGKTQKLPWSGEDWKVVTPPSPEELELQRLRELYEKQKKDSFQDGQIEDIEIGGKPAEPTPAGSGESAPQKGAKATPAGKAPAEDDAMKGATFDEAPAEDFSFEGDAAKPAPEPEPEAAAEPAPDAEPEPAAEPAGEGE